MLKSILCFLGIHLNRIYHYPKGKPVKYIQHRRCPDCGKREMLVVTTSETNEYTFKWEEYV